MTINIKQNLVSSSKYNIKCPYTMTPEYITIHNTANDAPATNEISYMISNNAEVSFHFAVDDIQAVQGLPLDRNGWHSSDGANGNGNRKSIAIEICYSKSGGDRFIKAEQNTAKLVAKLLKERGWGVDRIKTHEHWSTIANRYKRCPERTLDLGWDRFINMVKAEMDGKTVVTPTPQPTSNYQVGQTITVANHATHFANGATIASFVKGGQYTIMEVKTGQVLIGKGGTPTGWLLNQDIVGNTTTVAPNPESTPAPSTGVKVGDKVNLKGYLYTTSNATGKVNTSVKSGIVTKVAIGAKAPYLIGNGTGWVDDAGIGIEAPTPNPSPSKPKQTVHLSANESSWRVYPLTKSPTVGNECGSLNPKKFGGLTYEILRWTQPNAVAVIKTQDFGEVQIYVAAGTGAIIK